jgi:hypothetical protein
MGRGRQKAKHTKVARELKYFSPDTNYSALERELGIPDHHPRPPIVEIVEEAEPDQWSEYAEKYNNDDDDDIRDERE